MLWLILAAVLLLCFALTVLTVHQVLFTNQRSRLFSRFARRGRDPAFQAHRDEMREQMERAVRIAYTLTSSRGETLLGYYYPCGEKPCGRIALMVHGLGSNHTEACGMHYEYYHRRGFDVFCCENQGMKRRRGRVVGYGIFESEDCMDWLRFFTERFGEESCFILHGFSMGASTVLRLCDRCPPQVLFAVSDSGFSDAGRLLSARLRLLYPPVHLWNRLRLGYDLRETSVTEQVRHSRVPILFVHGEEDRVVPAAMGQELYTLCEGEKDCLWVDRAGHVESRHWASAEYDAKLDGMLSRYADITRGA